MDTPKHVSKGTASELEKACGHERVGKKARSTSRTQWETDQLWNVFQVLRTSQLFLSEHVDDIKTVAKTEKLGHVWKVLRKEIDLEDSTLLLNQVFFAPKREAESDHHAVQAKTDLFRRITTTKVTNGKQDTHTQISLIRSLRGVTAWKHTPKHVSKGTASLLARGCSTEQQSWHPSVLKLFSIACTWPDLGDLIYFGRSTCWHNQSPKGSNVGATYWRE